MRGHHSKVLTIGDCAKDIQEYYNDQLLSDIPSYLRKNPNFSEIHDWRVSYAATPSKLMRRTCAPNCKLHRPIFLILLLLVS
jgi:hypothetical protein